MQPTASSLHAELQSRGLPIVCLMASLTCAGFAFFEYLGDGTVKLPSSIAFCDRAEIMDIGKGTWQSRLIPFELVNQTGQDIRVIEVKKHCNCTNVRIPAGLVRKGAVFPGEITWNLGGLEGSNSTSMTIVYQPQPDVAHPQTASLLFTADVKAGYTLDKTTVSFDGRQAESQVVVLIPGLDSDARIHSVAT